MAILVMVMMMLDHGIPIIDNLTVELGLGQTLSDFYLEVSDKS